VGTEEVANLFVRTLSIGMVLGLANLIVFGLAPNSAAHAAHPNWSGLAPQAKRPLFRPTRGAQSGRTATRWRTQDTNVSRRATVRPAERVAYPVFAQGAQAAPAPSDHRNVGAAYPRMRIEPAFRPNDRSPVAEVVEARRAQRPVLPSQFRPARERSLKTYEDLWAAAPASRQAFAGRAVPYAPSPVLMLPGHGRYWPTW
jgi:hypothetical protein